ncbi:MAG TPA: secondary thiamine-phosphate synthase enzyme YjbQ [Bryobacteraceae bacterium]|nr:secondary thiamine-phosphate synthase enzyme YjbQ [Bryobacteraceae bacterium]
MKQFTHQFEVRTDGKGLYNVSRQIETWVREHELQTGLLTVFLQHTSASLTVQENADPDVLYDLADFFQKLAPDDSRLYRHTMEGPDDMPAHIRAALTMTQLSIPLLEGELALGTWQGIYVFEHRTQAHRRTLVLHLLGE